MFCNVMHQANCLQDEHPAILETGRIRLVLNSRARDGPAS